jgi:hypothetical protein
VSTICLLYNLVGPKGKQLERITVLNKEGPGRGGATAEGFTAYGRRHEKRARGPWATDFGPPGSSRRSRPDGQEPRATSTCLFCAKTSAGDLPYEMSQRVVIDDIHLPSHTDSTYDLESQASLGRLCEYGRRGKASLGSGASGVGLDYP